VLLGRRDAGAATSARGVATHAERILILHGCGLPVVHLTVEGFLTMMSRRVFRAVVAVLALVAASCSSKPATEAPGTATATPIHHLVVIFQENVSFDHYFGTYPHAANIDGQPFTALPGTPTVDGLTPELLTNNPNKG
jgi:hypothetical protein